MDSAEEVPDAMRERDMSEHDFRLDGWVRWDMPGAVQPQSLHTVANAVKKSPRMTWRLVECDGDAPHPGDFTDYYDVSHTKEKYTGYDGKNVWKFIHEKICFQVSHLLSPLSHASKQCLERALWVHWSLQHCTTKVCVLAWIRKALCSSPCLNDMNFCDDWGCYGAMVREQVSLDDPENIWKRDFNRMISGLHTSISAHIIDTMELSRNNIASYAHASSCCHLLLLVCRTSVFFSSPHVSHCGVRGVQRERGAPAATSHRPYLCSRGNS